MNEPNIEKLDLLDTEYAELLEKGIDPRKYLAARTITSGKLRLTSWKGKVVLSLLALITFGSWLIHFVPVQPSNNDATAELKVRLALEMQRQQLLQQKRNSP